MHNEIRGAIEPMAQLHQWITWKAGKPSELGKFKKFPRNVHTGGPAVGRHSDGSYLKNCGTLEQALSSLAKFKHAGLGFVVTQADPITAVDIDGCLSAGKLTDQARQIIEKIDSYTEVSPSGKGIRIFALAKLPPGALNNPPGLGVEIYDCNRFLTMTGNVFGALRAVKPAQEATNWVCANITGVKNKLVHTTPTGSDPLKGFPEGCRDTGLYKFACHLRGKNLSRLQTEALVLISARNCKPPFQDAEALAKVEAAWKLPTGDPYVAIPKKVVDSPAFGKLTNPARTAYMLLRRQIADGKQAEVIFPYGDACGFMDRKTFTKATRQLQGLGFIKIEKRRVNFQVTNVYQFSDGWKVK